MRDMTRLEQALVLLALYVWQWADALGELYVQLKESHYTPRGVDDPEWRRTLTAMAAPVRKLRLSTETGELPRMGLYRALGASEQPQSTAQHLRTLPVVTGTGVVLETRPGRPRLHRITKARVLSATLEQKVRDCEARVVAQLDNVVAETMRALGLTADEAAAILGAHHKPSLVAQVLA